MVLEESFQFIALLVVTLCFSFVAFLDTEYRLLLKVAAGICWFVLSLTQIYYFGGSQLLAVPSMFLFMAFGLVYCFSIVSDFKQKERDKVYGWMDDW